MQPMIKLFRYISYCRKTNLFFKESNFHILMTYYYSFNKLPLFYHNGILMNTIYVHYAYKWLHKHYGCWLNSKGKLVL